MKKIAIYCLIALCFALTAQRARASQSSWWQIQSVDTKSLSLDQAKSMSDNLTAAKSKVDDAMKAIADSGATHVTLDTPYDQSYIPLLEMFVASARAHNLHVWFHGNFSAWDGTYETHPKLIQEFLDTHAALFEEGDVFTSCPGCQMSDTAAYRTFLIAEYTIAKESFFHMGKNVVPDIFPMSVDVANATMDEETTRNLGGYVAINLSGKPTAQMLLDIRAVEEKSQGRIVLNSVDASSLVPELLQNKEVIGVNVSESITGTIDPNVHAYFVPITATGTVSGRDNSKLQGVTIATAHKKTLTDEKGSFVLPLLPGDTSIDLSTLGYHSQNLPIMATDAHDMDIRLEKEQYSWWYKLRLYVQRFF